MIYNTHYNILDALLLANTALVVQVADLVEPADKNPLNSAVAHQLFCDWWNEHGHHWHSSDRAAIFTIWEAVRWAKTPQGSIAPWWDHIERRLALAA